MTQYPDIFKALAAPFKADQIKERPGGNGRKLRYITARTAMNRLDEVLGPENWQDEYYEVCDVLFCRITIRLPDGSFVAKSDAGGFKPMTTTERGQTVDDEENTDKTGPSDAFKRAAAKFGIARYLYNDGVARLEGPAAAPQDAQDPEPAPTRPIRPERHPSDAHKPEPWGVVLQRALAAWNGFDPIADDRDRVAREHRIAHDIVSAGVADGMLHESKLTKPGRDGKPVRDPAKVWDAVKWLYGQQPDYVVQTIRTHLARVKAEGNGDDRMSANPEAA